VAEILVVRMIGVILVIIKHYLSIPPCNSSVQLGHDNVLFVIVIASSKMIIICQVGL